LFRQFAWLVQWGFGVFLGGVCVSGWGWCGCVSVVWVLVRWWRGFRILAFLILLVGSISRLFGC